MSSSSTTPTASPASSITSLILSSTSSVPSIFSTLVVGTPSPSESINETPASQPTRGSGEGRPPRSDRPIASSAALYLYTFLATLVLLLSVSAAIVIRSFILRRRHRRLVEEAIRNGTWVPPPPPLPGGRAPRVDLSKKPVMWEAYLGNNEHDAGYEEPREWDSIKPMSAAYLAPAVVPDPQAASTKTAAEPVLTRTLGSRVQSFGVGMRSGFRWLVGLPPRRPYDSSANASHINVDAVPATAESKIATSGPDGGPPVVRVSVIIAMPRPRSTPTPTPPPNIASSSSSAGILSPTINHPLSSHLQQRPPDLEEEEEPLPVMEMGVAELVVVDHEAEARKARESALLAMDAKEPIGRDSVSMTVEV